MAPTRHATLTFPPPRLKERPVEDYEQDDWDEEQEDYQQDFEEDLDEESAIDERIARVEKITKGYPSAVALIEIYEHPGSTFPAGSRVKSPTLASLSRKDFIENKTRDRIAYWYVTPTGKKVVEGTTTQPVEVEMISADPAEVPLTIQGQPVEVQALPRGGSPRAGVILDQLISIVIPMLPPDISEQDCREFALRAREQLLALIDATIVDIKNIVREKDLPPDCWTTSKRTEANLAAMAIVAKCPECELSRADQAKVAQYSGWGGLSLKAVESRFPPGMPRPEIRGLIHEYYTPSLVAGEIARVCQGLIPNLPTQHGQVLALEPAAGIGRLVRAFTETGKRSINWNVIEWSSVSSTMLKAMRPELTIHNMPFERWVTEYGAAFDGNLGLVLSNPPYGPRGAAVTEDPNHDYRERQAYAYFLRRGLDLLERNGLGVYLIPYGFMSGQGKKNRDLRELVLIRNHISAAYRLPSNLFPGALIVVDLIFFRSRGGQLDTIPQEDQFILEGEYFQQYPKHILGKEIGSQEGGDWEKRWSKRLEQIGSEETKRKKPRWGYQVEGDFKKLPELVERPLKYDLVSRNYLSVDPEAMAGGIARDVKELQSTDEELTSANSLGMRLDTYLRIVASKDNKKAAYLYQDIRDGLIGWVSLYGNPHAHAGIATAAAEQVTGVERFLTAFEKSGTLVDGLRTKPKYVPVFTGSKTDIIGQADWLFRQSKVLTIKALLEFNKSIGGNATAKKSENLLVAADWALDGENWDQFVPPDIYYTGWLQPRYEATEQAKESNPQISAQYYKLREKMGLLVFDQIGTLDPRQGWIPLSLVEKWVNTNEYMQGAAYNPVHIKLEYRKGLYRIVGVHYDDMGGAGKEVEDLGISRETVNLLGYMNYDMTLFRPEKSNDEDLTEKRFEYAARWAEYFGAFLASKEEYRLEIEQAYMKQFRGWVEPEYSAEPWEIARWGEMITPHGYQVQGARRLVTNRGGLLAYDVGVGKTFTAILTIAVGRQEGWIRRPIVLCPNTLVWKWQTDFRKCVPDYRCVVIGATKVMKYPSAKDLGGIKVNPLQKDLLSRMAFGGVKISTAKLADIKKLESLKLINRDGEITEHCTAERCEKLKLTDTQRDLLVELVKGDKIAVNHTLLTSLVKDGLVSSSGELTELGKVVTEKLKGKLVSKTDSPEERARKWTSFQAGQYDVAILTFSSLPRTKMNITALEGYASRSDSIQRDIEIQTRNAKKKGEPTERQEALLKEGAAAWLAERTEIAKSQRYDPGIDWDALGIDWLVVDEAQNFKNLYMPESREGGVPKYMGGGTSSKRAWQLDFRAWSIRQNTGGGGIVLLSATPAKNSPLEFYNILQYIDDKIWTKRGIYNAEQFVSRYVVVEIQQSWDTTTITMVKKPCVTGFANVSELRDAIYRYGQFLQADEAGLTLPEVSQGDPFIVTIYDDQEDKYIYYLDQAKQAKDDRDFGKVLGLLARMSLVALHARLDEKFSLKTAPEADPHSAKIDAVAKRVMANTNCGHIIFVEALAAQVWMKMVLEEEGMSSDRIALMNAESTKSSVARNEVARGFNGGLDNDDMPDDTVDPLYDVVIANQVAYEGIDLQRRTCEIHHLDLPWEPSSLQQRNGRGLRQGNILGVISINVYLAARTNDVARWDSIRGKHGWMKALLGSDQNEISNPAQAMKMSRLEADCQMSRDPEETRRLYEEVERESKIADAARQNSNAAKQASAVAAVWKRLRAQNDPKEIESLRLQAKRMTLTLTKYSNATIWPWLTIFEGVVKDQDVWVVKAGPPIFTGLKLGMQPGAQSTSRLQYRTSEIGKLKNLLVWYRPQDKAGWSSESFSEWEKNGEWNLNPPWDESEAALRETILGTIDQYGDPWPRIEWRHGTDEWLRKWWPEFAEEIFARWIKNSYYGQHPQNQLVPAIVNGRLEIVAFGESGGHYDYGVNAYVGATSFMFVRREDTVPADPMEKVDIPPDLRIVPPTNAGFEEFCQLAAHTKHRISMLNLCADYWWSEMTPPGYVAGLRTALKPEKGVEKED